MSVSDRMDEVLVQVKLLREKAVPHPRVFQAFDPDPDALIFSEVQELAMRAAAQREFMGELLSQVRKQLALAEVVAGASRHDFDVEFQQAFTDAASTLIARGYAWKEREAKANLSVLERRVEHRGVEMKLAQVKSLVSEVEDCYRAWRDTEWSIDRLVRLLTLRHAIGEV